MAEVFLSIGSNIEPEVHIPSALESLRAEFGPVRQSSTYVTAAVGFEGPTFHNLVVSVHTDRSPADVAEILRRIEQRHGRTPESRKFSSRTMDIDLLLYDDLVSDEDHLRLPRDDITRYAFVLQPLAEIAPAHRHPVSGETYQALWDAFERQAATPPPG